jgi:hypothetical protein
MALTNFPNGISSMGLPVIGSGGMIPPGPGKVYFVDYTNGVNAGPGTSISNPWQTIEYAYSQVTSGNDDIIALMGSATHVLSAMLDVSKSRVHFIGIDGTNGRLYGQNAKVSLTATSGASNIGTILNTGVRNSFTNIKFINESTVTEGIYCFVEGGEYTLIQNCEIYKATDLDQTGAAEMVWNGDSTQMIGCTIGSLANAISGSIIRPCITLQAGLAGAGKVCRDGLIVDTLMWRQSGATTNVFINAAAATDVERQLLLKNVGFINSKASAALPAVCIRLAATLTVGNIILDPTCYASNVTKIATATGVIVTGAAPNSGTGIGVNAA